MPSTFPVFSITTASMWYLFQLTVGLGFALLCEPKTPGDVLAALFVGFCVAAFLTGLLDRAFLLLGRLVGKQRANREITSGSVAALREPLDDVDTFGARQKKIS
mgnify:CR=1 FL=1